MTRSLRRVALASLFVAACGTGETRPSILLISIDTLRRDHVGTYGHPRPTTPVLDALASEGAAFENAVSTSNWTLPAHMSMWTGLSPSAHQVEDDRDGLAPSILTFVETLRENGYATAGFASHAYLEARYGFSRGFDRYAVGIDQRAETVSRQAVAWLDSEPEPFFLFLHYFDPHWDYRPPIGFDTRFGARRPGAGRFRTLAPFFDPERSMPGSLRRQAMALYDGEIAYTDDQIGRVLERLRRQDRLDDTIVAVVSDHGEEFGDHGAFGHGTHLHAELTRIPFLLRFPPRIAAGTRPSALASLSDLPATLLSLAELEVPEQFAREGVAHFTREPGAVATGERQVFLESTRWGPKRFAVRTRTHKLVGPASYQPVRFERRRRRSVPIVSSPIERETALYDLTNDPGETADRIGDPAAAAALTDLRRALHAFVASTVPGVRLACRQATEASPEFTGVLRFAESLVDEPFPEPAISPARVATLGPLQFRVTLRAGSDAGGIVFPVSDAPGDVTVALARDADPLFAGSVRVPEPGGEQPLGAGAAGGCALRTDFASGRHRGSVELDEEDLETLRALGYAQ